MLPCLALPLLVLIGGGQAVFSHSPDVSDTVRYNRDEFGLVLHVPGDVKGRPMLLTPGGKLAITATPMEAIDGTSYRGRIRTGPNFRYAFWLGATKYKAGVAGKVLDQSGVHETAAPEWFSQGWANRPIRNPPRWPAEGAVFYALDTDRFGDGTPNQLGTLGLEKHMDYVQALGVNGVWFTGKLTDIGDAVDIAKRADLHVVVESDKSVNGADGIASGQVPTDFKGWRIVKTQTDSQNVIGAGKADTAEDLRWRTLVYGFVRDIRVTPTQFEGSLRRLREDYSDSAAEELVLRIGGPSQPRPSAVLKGDHTRLLQLWALLFTLPGVPILDAGDEVGLMDQDYEMLWDPTRQDASLLDAIKKLILARTTRPSLYRGTFTALLTDDEAHVYAFERQDRFQATVVLFNNGDDPQSVRLPSAQFGSNALQDLFGNASFNQSGASLSVNLPPHSFALLGT